MEFDKISKYNVNKFDKFIKYHRYYINNKSLKYLFILVWLNISSNIVLKRCLWNKLIAERQNKLLS